MERVYCLLHTTPHASPPLRSIAMNDLLSRISSRSLVIIQHNNVSSTRSLVRSLANLFRTVTEGSVSLFDLEICFYCIGRRMRRRRRGDTDSSHRRRRSWCMRAREHSNLFFAKPLPPHLNKTHARTQAWFAKSFFEAELLELLEGEVNCNG